MGSSSYATGPRHTRGPVCFAHHFGRAFGSTNVQRSGEDRMLRTMELPDYDRLISTMDDWWDGRRVHDKLPRLFVEHFRDTSLVIEEGDAIVGFLVGFV